MQQHLYGLTTEDLTSLVVLRNSMQEPITIPRTKRGQTNICTTIQALDEKTDLPL